MKVWKALDDSITEGPPFVEERSSGLYPSEASAKVNGVVYGKCMRAVVLRWHAAQCKPVKIQGEEVHLEPEQVDAKGEWIFELGRRCEDAILDRAKLANIYRWGHMKFKIKLDVLTISGELDGIFWDPKEEKNFGVEIKSVSGAKAEIAIFGSASYRQKGFKGSPKTEHIMQTAIYAWYYRENLDHFKILYLMRDKCLREEFKVEVKLVDGIKVIFIDGVRWKDFTLDDIINRYKETESWIKTNQLPPRDYDYIYSDERMNLAVRNGELGKTDKEAWLKYWEREEEHKAGKKVRQLKRPMVSDWQCLYCSFFKVCYTPSGKPRGEDNSNDETILSTDLDNEVVDQKVVGDLPSEDASD